MYPKWVTRAHGIGPVLCLNEEEEAQLLADWEAQTQPEQPEEAEEQQPKRRGRPPKAVNA